MRSERALEKEIYEWLVDRFKDHLVVRGGELDFAILVPPPEQAGVRFIECKVRTRKRQRVGVGAKGRRAQIALLLRPWCSASIVRWCVGDLTLTRGSARYALLTSVEAAGCPVGKEFSHEKQNNLQINEALRAGLTWGALLDKIDLFVRTGR